MPFSEAAQGASPLDAPYLSNIPLSQTGYKVNIDDPMGAQIRFTGDGMAVYMLHREPGVYLNDHGRKVPMAVAREAGFDVERWEKARRRQEALKKAARAIDDDFSDNSQFRVLAEAEEYRVTEIAPGYCNIEFVDDTAPPEERYTVLNTRGPVSAEVAMKRFQELTGSAAAEASQPVDADVEKVAAKKAK